MTGKEPKTEQVRVKHGDAKGNLRYAAPLGKFIPLEEFDALYGRHASFLYDENGNR